MLVCQLFIFSYPCLSSCPFLFSFEPLYLSLHLQLALAHDTEATFLEIYYFFRFSSLFSPRLLEELPSVKHHEPSIASMADGSP